MTVSQPFSADKDEKMNKKEEVSIGECKNNMKRKSCILTVSSTPPVHQFSLDVRLGLLIPLGWTVIYLVEIQSVKFHREEGIVAGKNPPRPGIEDKKDEEKLPVVWAV
ncbi:hypothetical protein RUM43_003922 [Polyplax serrata]|uniref:Uncharacterized protein n=1 Tax=Polyplax serrata TaxID=468196 RepID=A0AAN8S8E8_POLSC